MADDLHRFLCSALAFTDGLCSEWITHSDKCRPRLDLAALSPSRRHSRFKGVSRRLIRFEVQLPVNKHAAMEPSFQARRYDLTVAHTMRDAQSFTTRWA